MVVWAIRFCMQQTKILQNNLSSQTSKRRRHSSAATKDRTSSISSILPSFDPAPDDPREYVDKVKFIHSICPAKDKPMLAPRLVMLMKGTAWAQIRSTDTSKVPDPEQGIRALLSSVATWEEAAGLQTYEKLTAPSTRSSRRTTKPT